MAMGQAALDWSCDHRRTQPDSSWESILAQVLSEIPGYLCCSEQDFKVHVEDLE